MARWIGAIILALHVQYKYGHKCRVIGKHYQGEWYYVVMW